MHDPARNRGAPVALWRCFVFAAMSLGLDADRAAAQTTVNIDVFNFDFGDFSTGQGVDPTITVGDTIRWNFVDGVHTSTSDSGQAVSWDSDVRFPGDTFSKQFNTPGTYTYFCSMHLGLMAGTITVQPVPEPASVLLVAALALLLVGCYRHRARSGPRLAAVCAPAGRPARSLVEVLVVLGILGLLTGMLLPAVQRVRESSNYLTCRNNLRQIGLAMHNHEAQHGHFPGPGTEPYQVSVLARVLPYVELDSLHRRIDPARPLFVPRGDYGRLDPAQAEAARTVVPRFLCPTDGQSALCSAYDQATLAGTNYVFNAGTGLGTYYDFRYPTDGVFWYGSKLRHAEVIDGLANTVFVSEALLGAGADAYRPEAVDPRRHWRTAGCHAAPTAERAGTTPLLTQDLCHSDAVGMYWRGDRNISWIGGPGHRSLFNTYLRPNDSLPDFASFGLGWFKASSNHPGGVNVILGDGSVHFIRNDIDLDTWRALSTRGIDDKARDYCGCHQ
jgi:plastocyanin/type II secretory pathway pseudopilin PulG